MIEWWDSLGPIAPCALLFLGGVLFVLGAFFRWQWLYPDHPNVRYYSTFFRRVVLFLGGIALMAAGIAFYIFRDHLSFYSAGIIGLEKYWPLI